MPTVVFVHGTGVRQPRYGQTLAVVTQAVQELRPGTDVRGCFWGERFGATLASGGASIPQPAGSRDLAGPQPHRPGPPAVDPDDDVDAWWVLYLDPTAELRATAPTAPADLPPPGREAPADLLAERARAAADDPGVVAVADRAGLGGTIWRATEDILTHPDVRAALPDCAEAGTAPALLVRAIVAEAVRQLSAADADLPGLDLAGLDPPALDGAARDELVATLLARLDPEWDSRAMPAAVTAVLARTARLAWNLAGAPAAERRRASILAGAHPLPGDVLVYLARGGAIRDLIAAEVRASGEPVVLLAHSLGGVACVDLLVEQPQLPVAALVTVGSQAPLLYELGALPSLRPPSPLPPAFPAWVNVYDARDLLAFVGGPVFGERVRDVPVDGRQPFPHAHSAYWRLPAFRRVLDGVLPPDDPAGGPASGGAASGGA